MENAQLPLPLDLAREAVLNKPMVELTAEDHLLLTERERRYVNQHLATPVPDWTRGWSMWPGRPKWEAARAWSRSADSFAGAALCQKIRRIGGGIETHIEARDGQALWAAGEAAIAHLEGRGV